MGPKDKACAESAKQAAKAAASAAVKTLIFGDCHRCDLLFNSVRLSMRAHSARKYHNINVLD